MKSPSHCNWRELAGFAGIFLTGGILLAQEGRPTATVATATANTSGSSSPQNQPLPEGILAWDRMTKDTNVVVSDGQAQVTYSFTNLTAGRVTIQDILTSCGCTTAQAPRRPWIIPAGASEQFGLTVRLVGKARHQSESAEVVTDQGFKVVFVNVNILPPAVPPRSKTERARDHELALADRQAIFHGECAVCHVKSGDEQDGRTLYFADCAICHEAQDRPATTVDLFTIKTPANVSFWLDWIALSKAGTVMPAFSRKAGGPLSDLQIAYLARFLNTADNLDSAP